MILETAKLALTAKRHKTTKGKKDGEVDGDHKNEKKTSGKDGLSYMTETQPEIKRMTVFPNNYVITRLKKSLNGRSSVGPFGSLCLLRVITRNR